MSINRRCPRCGGDHVQLSDERSKHGCLWFLIFGVYYLVWVAIKWAIGLMLFFMLDWWLAILMALLGKPYIWKCRSWFSGVRRYYYCHNCGNNFRI